MLENLCIDICSWPNYVNKTIVFQIQWDSNECLLYYKLENYLTLTETSAADI